MQKLLKRLDSRIIITYNDDIINVNEKQNNSCYSTQTPAGLTKLVKIMFQAL